MRSRRLSPTWLSLAPLLLAGACGSPPPLPQIDACTLLTRDDAQAITGVPMVASLGSAVPGAPKNTPGECIYSAEKKDDQRRLGLSAQAFADREEAAHIFELTTNALPSFAGHPPQPVPGLADRAVWSAGELNKLFVLSGRYRLTVGSMAVNPDTALAAAKDAATRALARLPK